MTHELALIFIAITLGMPLASKLKMTYIYGCFFCGGLYALLGQIF
jgi:hypothetical protein